MKSTHEKGRGARTQFLDLRAEDVMQRDLVTVNANATLSEVERILADARVSGAPVVDADGHIVGVVSTTDLVGRRAEGEEEENAGNLHRDADAEFDDEEYAAYTARAGETVAAQLMNPEVVKIDADARLPAVARAMVDQQVHRLLVSKDGDLVGIVSTMDLLRAMAR